MVVGRWNELSSEIMLNSCCIPYHFGKDHSIAHYAFQR